MYNLVVFLLHITEKQVTRCIFSEFHNLNSEQVMYLKTRSDVWFGSLTSVDNGKVYNMTTQGWVLFLDGQITIINTNIMSIGQNKLCNHRLSTSKQKTIYVRKFANTKLFFALKYLVRGKFANKK